VKGRIETERPLYFVWVRGLRGPEPQLWDEMYYGVANWKREYVLGYQLLLDDKERRLPLDELARRYPLISLIDGQR
jgi:hypothetical protein